MPWTSLTTDDVARKIAGPELDACRDAALADGQSDPLPAIIADAVNEVRGYVAGCPKNKLGPAGTVPAQLVATALVLIRTAALNRLPVSSLHTESRRNEYTDAIGRLKDAAACRFVLEQPEETGPEKLNGTGTPRIKPKPLSRQPADADGI